MITTIANHKGGVGKTTMTQNIAVLYAMKNKKTLIIDLDLQANLTLAFNSLNKPYNIYHLLSNQIDINNCIYETNIKNLYIIPGSKLLKDLVVQDLAILKNKLELIKDKFNMIIIDTPPLLNGTTELALISSDNVLIPLHAELFSLQGLNDEINKVNEIKQLYNPNLYIKGLILTEYTNRFLVNNEFYNQIVNKAKNNDIKVFKTTIRHSIAIATAQGQLQPVVIANNKCSVSEDFKKLYKELIKDEKK